jgi:multidrug efflux pump subunit AcrA (membrane-fusion protein)
MIDRTACLLNGERRRPTIPTRTPRRMAWKWVGLFAVVLGGLAALGFWLRPGRGADEVRAPGVVEAPEVRLGSRLGGRVAAVHVEEGQLVEAGQVLVTFEARELTARRDQVQAQLAAARAAQDRVVHGPLAEELAEAQAAADAAHARLDRAQAGPREEQTRQAQGELEVAQAEQRKADLDFARAERLVRTAALSQADYDAALVARERAGSRVRIAQAALEQLRGARPEEVAEARADFARLQARSDLLRRGARQEDRDAAAAAVAHAQAQLDEAEAALREAVVTAPERGVVAAAAARPGSVVAAGQPVVVFRPAAPARRGAGD